MGVTIGFRCTAITVAGMNREDYLYDMDILYFSGTRYDGTTKHPVLITELPIGFSDDISTSGGDITFYIKNNIGFDVKGKYLLQNRYWSDPGEVDSP